MTVFSMERETPGSLTPGGYFSAWLVGRNDLDRERIFLMCFSPGTTVAAHVVANRPVIAVVLAAPFESVSAIVQQRLPYLAVIATVDIQTYL